MDLKGSLPQSSLPGTSTKTVRNKHISTKTDTTVLVAVALQDHIIRNLKLQNLSLSNTFNKKPLAKRYGHRPMDKRLASSVVDTGLKKIKPKRQTEEDEGEEYVLDPKPPQLSLAQKLGLIDGPEAPLTASEWQRVKKRSVQQGDSSQPCVICKEEFGIQQQVLLSCSHVFHRVCLQAFERFSGRKSCPMCRKQQYETRVIHDGAHLYRNKCATRIQACWRGYIVRKWYRQLRRSIPPKNKKLRRRFFEDKLEEINDRLLRSCHTNIDEFLSELDHSVATSRRVIQQFEEKCLRNISENEWEKIQLKQPQMNKEKAIQREGSDCPICITPLYCFSNTTFPTAPGTTERREEHGLSVRRTVLLSCSHAFHYSCLQAFEDFTEGQKHVCPLCRSTYQKRII
eukprot:gi/632979522/ref/XP_007906517.1/ PREDICTED: RING finger protein 32 isoform X2 [Callorhinchus milii]